MFFDALLKLAIVFIFGTFLITFVWLTIYHFLGFLMPDWLAGLFAKPIIWVRYQKPAKLAALAIIASTGVDVFIWHYLWLWTIILGGVGAFCVWFFSKE
jgi:hypothetical protein